MKQYVTPTFVLPTPESLARSQENRTGVAYLEWYDTIVSTQTLSKVAHIDPDAYLSLMNASHSCEAFLLLIEGLSEFAKENPYEVNCVNYFFQFVNSSRFELSAWVDSVHYFYKWLNKNSRQAGLTEILSYIDSASKGPSISAEASLKDIVVETLERFGYQT